MRIGDTITSQAIKDQKEHPYVSLFPLSFDGDGNITGGTVHAFAQTCDEAYASLTVPNKEGHRTLVVSGGRLLPRA
jgi:hypothetical protein